MDAKGNIFEVSERILIKSDSRRGSKEGGSCLASIVAALCAVGVTTIGCVNHSVSSNS